MVDIPDLQQADSQRMASFNNIDEYLKTMRIEYTRESETLKANIRTFEDFVHVIRLVEIRTTTKESTY